MSKQDGGNCPLQCRERRCQMACGLTNAFLQVHSRVPPSLALHMISWACQKCFSPSPPGGIGNHCSVLGNDVQSRLTEFPKRYYQKCCALESLEWILGVVRKKGVPAEGRNVQEEVVTNRAGWVHGRVSQSPCCDMEHNTPADGANQS